MSKIEVTRPEQMEGDVSQLEQALKAFELQFQKEDKGESYYHLVISGEVNRKTCDEIERIYLAAGWKSAKCRTSSENGERAGLTGLILNK